jgi:hypothetical protein
MRLLILHGHCYFIFAIGRPVLLTELVKLSLNGLHDLGVLGVLVRDVYMQRTLLDKFLVQRLLLDVMVELLVERMVKREAIIDAAQ